MAPSLGQCNGPVQKLTEGSSESWSKKAVCVRTIREDNTPPLFRLPEKIRKKIYADAVTYRTPISIHKHCTSDGWYDGRRAFIGSAKWRFMPSLLRTCRQIRNEAAPIYYSDNAFLAIVRDGGMSEMITWLRETNPTYLSPVKLLILTVEPTSLGDLLEMTKASKGTAIREQARQLVTTMREAGFSAESVKVSTPELRHLSKDALLLHFVAEDAENIRTRWISALEEEMRKIEEDEGLVESLKRLTTEHIKL